MTKLPGLLTACGLVLGVFAAPAALQAADLSQFCNGADDGDDTACIRNWIAAGKAAGEELYAPAGTYIYSGGASLHSGAVVRCESNTGTVFKSRDGTAPGALFTGSSRQNVTLKNCGFDLNGNPDPFLTVISFGGSTPNRNILIENNRMFDSRYVGRTSPEQRQYILILNCDGCVARDNFLSGGGRIKLGRPGVNMLVEGNTVEWVNDNGITVVGRDNHVSHNITIRNNKVLFPVETGIFFGADGTIHRDPRHTTTDVLVENNEITVAGRVTACITGTLGNVAERITVKGNKCTRTEVGPNEFSRGININRTSPPSDGSAQRLAKDVNVFENTVEGPFGLANIFVSGRFDAPEVIGNTVRNTGTSGDSIRVRGTTPGCVVRDNRYRGRISAGTCQLINNTIVP